MQSATTSANPTVAGHFRDAEPPPIAVATIVAKREPPKKKRRWFELPAYWLNRFRNLSAMSISGLVHVILAVVLAFLATLQTNSGPRGIEIDSSVVNDSVAAVTFEIVKPDSTVPTPESSDTTETAKLSTSVAFNGEVASESATSQSVTLSNLSPIQIKTSLESMIGNSSTFTPSHSVFAHSSLDGRSVENRTKLALSRGGSQASEQAVEAALVWLTAHQHQDGGWSMMLADPNGPCNGKCRHSTIEILDAKRFAATGLALLTYLGAGYTHRDGMYRDQVYRGLMFLMDRMKLDAPNGNDPRIPDNSLRRCPSIKCTSKESRLWPYVKRIR